MSERLRLAFTELGPSFIKLAQLLSTRPDLIGPQYAEEFKKLQDKVPPFPSEEAKRIVESEIKLPLDRVFGSFEDEPVAAASIAQVHQAVLLDGNSVIVKVQRPDIKEQLETDIDILFTVANLMLKNIPESQFLNPVGIVEEFQKTVKKELNFVEEGQNACRFRRNFEKNPDVYFPVIYPDYLSEKVLVMERIEGVRIDDIESIRALGFDLRELAKTGVDMYFKMILQDGFFHGDPHPGNIFITPSGQIAMMDFGIVGRVNESLKEVLAQTFMAFIKRDFDRLIDQYIELGMVSEDVDLDEFRREFKADLEDFLEPLYGMTLGEIQFAEYFEAVMRISVKHSLRLPSDMILIDKAMLILNDIGVKLDPALDFVAASEPYVTKLLKERMQPGKVAAKVAQNITDAGDFFVMLPKQMRKVIRKVLRNDLHMKMTHLGLEQYMKDIDRSSNRIAFALVLSAMLISSAIMHATGVGPTVYGMSILGFITFGFAAVLGIWLLVSIFRSGRL
jgi:ubiquinone biosynthesis protein